MKSSETIFRGTLLALCAAVLFVVFSGCNDRTEVSRVQSIYELNSPDFAIGGMTGSVAMNVAQAQLPSAHFAEFAMPVDAFTALCARKIDAVVLDRPTLGYMTLAHPELAVMKEDLALAPISVATSKANAALMTKVNEFIRLYRSDGTYKAMLDRWFFRQNSAMPVLKQAPAGNRRLKIGITANNEPLAFVRNGELAGFDAEFAQRFARFMNAVPEFFDLPYDALVPALESGKIDLAVAFMDALPERCENVLFSDNYVDAPITILIHRDRCDLPESAAADENSGGQSGMRSAARSLKASFIRTFIRENRWKLILRGLLTTLVITVCAVILGTLLAFPLCMMCRSRHAVLVWLGERYISIVMGTPILVILMILYYVIFAKVDISGVAVAILAFAMDFAAYTGVTLRAGIEAVPAGQLEAALALGHSPLAAFQRFILPQAVRSMLPVYRAEIISTLKATSIVGYIAIMDLTKTGDIIRSRTYEAFFPLIAIAVIYFLMAKCLTSLLIFAEKKLNPDYRRNQLQKKDAGHD